MNTEKMPNILRHWGNSNQNCQREMAEGLGAGMETKRTDTLAEDQDLVPRTLTVAHSHL